MQRFYIQYALLIYILSAYIKLAIYPDESIYIAKQRKRIKSSTKFNNFTQ